MSAPGMEYQIARECQAAIEWLFKTNCRPLGMAEAKHFGVFYGLTVTESQKWMKRFQEIANQSLLHPEWDLDECGAWFEVQQ